MPAHLLLIGIGPVHEFIEQARRTRDVWFGSWILSDLARTIAQSLKDQQCQLIFPHDVPPSQSDTLTHAAIANQILASTERPVQDVIRIARQAFNTRLKHLWKDALEHLSQATVMTPEQTARGLAQVTDVFEFHWAWVPFLPHDYQAQRQQLYALFNARKNTRTFASIPWESSVPTRRQSNKSSLDGWREAITTGEKQGENLSGVDLLKRYTYRGKDDSAFPSTSHIAALPFAHHLKRIEPTINRAWERYMTNLDGLHRDFTRYERVPKRFRAASVFGIYDGSLIYESRLGEDLRLPNATPDARKDRQSLIAQARGHLADFFSSQSNLPTIPPGYYAILAADGDHMGSLISSIEELEHHQQLSKIMAEFAQSAAQLVENDYEGAVIYAGGDDVLALVPLHTVIACATELARRFASALNVAFVRELIQRKNLLPPTLSVGVAIVHHLEALQDSLKLARDAEKKAKERRNSLAIILSKRNGGDTTITGQWGSDFLADVERLITLHHDEEIPDGFIFELRDLAMRFDMNRARGEDEKTAWREIMRLESQRILQRKQTPRGTAVNSRIVQELLLMLERTVATDLEDKLRSFVDCNIVARELAAMQRMVDG